MQVSAGMQVSASKFQLLKLAASFSEQVPATASFNKKFDLFTLNDLRARRAFLVRHM
jgi:hypothetical protein